jgi:REP element-mobilizing transposase RayT
MSTRKTEFATGEFYHIYNRGVDKRIVFSDQKDLERFFQSMNEFNTLEPIGSLYENSFKKDKENEKNESKKLVQFISYCLNPNHFHFILEQVADQGIEKFMHRLSTGYTRYFNQRYRRSGALFQGRYKSVHIDTNEYLLHVSAYVNLNDKVHQLGGSTSKLVNSMTSFDEYTGKRGKAMCNSGVILEQFRNKKEYTQFAKESLQTILQKKKDLKELELLLLE